MFNNWSVFFTVYNDLCVNLQGNLRKRFRNVAGMKIGKIMKMMKAELDSLFFIANVDARGSHASFREKDMHWLPNNLKQSFSVIAELLRGRRKTTDEKLI